ncbi:MAG: signal recognition particle-docking protein FtsY [Oscillospiraceae bacterium]|nr:signal recognition particle-docking protein FtsY [Oscillospiraceae bacterium]
MGLFDKLKQGLKKTKDTVIGQVNNILKAFVRIDEDLLDELEEILIASDVGVNTASEIIERLRGEIKERRLSDGNEVKNVLQEIIEEIIGDNEGLILESNQSNKINQIKPSVILVIGVNGAGKTTSIGKLADILRRDKKTVTVAAADTFRAAAIEQLEVWTERAGVDIIKHQEGSDPAAVVYDAIQSCKSKKTDVLIIDTAGRLHNKKNLMDELAKISRVINREIPEASVETLLVLDATTGQNAVNQAREFKNSANITGIILTKLDSSSKGGIVISVRRELGIPIKFIGVGEKIDDLDNFDGKEFARALFD